MCDDILVIITFASAAAEDNSSLYLACITKVHHDTTVDDMHNSEREM